MTYTIRKLVPTDYDDILVGWWKNWRWTAPDKDFLSDNGTGGIMVSDGDIPVCAGFMIATNSKVAWIEWIISNRNYRDRLKRKEAIKLLISTLTNTSKGAGYKYCYAILSNPSLIHAYKELGYMNGSSNGIEMIKAL